MAVSNWWKRSRKAIASTTAILVVIGVPTTFAVLHEGFPITDVDLTTRDVWVTNGEQFLAGRLNRQIEELNGAVSAASNGLDVVQNGTNVFLVDNVSGSIERIDPAFTRLVERVDLPASSTVVLGGTSLAILSPAKGELWVVDVANGLDFSPSDSPAVELGKGARVTVSPEGRVFATSSTDQKLFTIDGVGAKPTERQLEFGAAHQLTAVGERAVILDTDKNTLVTDDGTRTELGENTGLKLQQPGKPNDQVIVATGDGLLRVPLGGGTPELSKAPIDSPLVDPNGVSSPVWLDGCAHGAWGGAQQYLLSCDDEKAVSDKIPQPTQGSIVEFRVNKSVIALNNLNNGNVWLVDNEMRLVENWDEVTPPLEDETEEGDEKSSTQSFEDTLAERTDQNRVPLARDDQFGLRPGRTTILPVLENDTDPDGDVLTITATSALDESVGVLDYIDGGRALQFTPAEGTSTASFRYTVDDGRDGVAEAYVSLRVVPNAAANTAPEEKRTTSVSVEARGTINYNVLTDWIDPDGDDLTLISAAPVSGDDVRFTPDGFLTFESKSSQLGEKEVRLVVGDGDLTMTGTFLVDVKAPGTLPPIGTPDYAEVFVNETVVIKPIDNDVTPSGEDLVLLNVDKLPKNATVSPNLERQTVGFSAPKAGTYYFFYGVGAGAKSSIGLVRVDVREEPKEPLPPIAVKDTAYLRANEPTVVKVLANDVSPTGLVLAIQGTDTDSTATGLSVEVLNNTNIRITSSSALTEQTQFTYTISDGAKTALAGVTVVPVAPIVNRQPPVAMDEAVSVRAGDIVSVDVLSNDYHPDDSQLILDPDLVDVSNTGGGLAFVNGKNVRYQAPREPGDYTAVYRVTDKFGESATATVTFVVKAPDLESNQPPLPEPQTARVFAGEKVLITIPLDTIDPDGDSVMLTRFVQPPTKGVPSEQTENSFVYKADVTNTGTDTIRYEVEDTFGAKAQGVIQIGVIPQGESKEPPNAVDDSVEIRPGRTASVDVLLNDSDPNGASLSVTDPLVEVDKGIEARVSKSNKVVLQAPDVEGTFSIRYQIENGKGGVDQAFLQVRVTKDAKPIYPTAEDYYVPIDDVLEGDAVVVDLDGLIANPSGLDEDLVISLEGPNADIATFDQDTRTVSVTPQELRTAVAYRVTNAEDNLSGTAFIVIPPKVSASYSPPPYLRTDLGDVVVDMNSETEWKLEDLLVVPSGRPAVITAKSTVKAPRSDGSSPYVDKSTIRFAPLENYRGAASITFEVTDGKDADDINGNKATIVFGFSVGDPNFTDTPPEFTTQNVTIEAGEPDTTVDLRASSSHPNPSVIGQLRYENLSGANSAIQANISGGNLLIRSDRGVQPGQKTTLRFVIKYEDFEVPGVVTVSTVRSTKPLSQPVEDAAKGKRGVQQGALNVLANDYNPFAATNEPLRLTDARIDNAAQSGATVSHTPDGNVTIVPGPTFIGVVSVVYTVRDATDDPTRDTQGRYLLTVRDVPSKVDPPVATPGDLRASVTWRTPDTNGEPIDSYTVTWTPAQGAGGGSATVPGNAASHTVTGLTNGTDYRFRVVAHNILGPSTISDESNAARPKGQATAPTALSLSATDSGNGQINMSWSGAGANGGEITGYVWTAWAGATAVGTGETTGAANATWAGNVGTAYTFSVVAKATGGDSNPSARSVAATPRPGKPGVSLTAPGGLGDYTVNGGYTAANSRGANPTYSWSVSGGGPSGNQNAPHNFSFGGNPSSTYTLTVTVTVGGVSNSASNTATTPAAQPPAPTEWQMNASVNTCPENYALSSGNYHAGGPSCDVPWVRGDFHVQCKKPGADWYRFRDGSRSYGSNMLVRGDTFTGPKGSVPNC